MLDKLEKLYAKPHKIFLWIALFFGIIYIFLLPPFAGIDEDHHFARIIALSQGKLLDAAILPKYFVAYVDKQGKIILDFFYFGKSNLLFGFNNIYQSITATHDSMGSEKLYEYNRAVVYSPIPYISAIPTAFIAIKLSLHPIIVLYLIRISIFAASTFIIYYAIKITPLLKWHFLFLALLQTSVLVRSTASADPLTISYIFIFIAFILKKVTSDKFISLKDSVIIFVISCAICLSKTAYILVPILFFVIPNRLFLSRLQHIKLALILVLVPILIGGFWFLFSSGAYHAIPTIEMNNKYSIAYSRNTGTNEYEQIFFILNNPIYFIKVILHSIFSTLSLIKLSVQFVEVNGNGQSAPLNAIYVIISLLIVPLFVLFLPIRALENHSNLESRNKLICLSIYITSFILLCAMFYIANTEVGSQNIEGLQGRYFMPTLPLFCLAISRIIDSEKSYNLIISAMILFVISLLSNSVFYLLEFYYGLF